MAPHDIIFVAGLLVIAFLEIYVLIDEKRTSDPGSRAPGHRSNHGSRPHEHAV